MGFTGERRKKRLIAGGEGLMSTWGEEEDGRREGWKSESVYLCV